MERPPTNNANRTFDDGWDDGATILDDGLSVCDEENTTSGHLTSAEASARRKDAKRYRRCTICLLITSFLISTIVAAIISFGNPRITKSENGHRGRFGGDDGGWELDLWGNGLKEKENKERLVKALEYLSKKEVSDPLLLTDEASYGTFGTSYSPQYRAALWLAKHDTYRIEIPSAPAAAQQGGSSSSNYVSPYSSTPSYDAEYPFLQRYSLAVLFLSLGGAEHWLWKVNFLRGWHECGWFDSFAIQGYENQFVFGVLCDGEPDYNNRGAFNGGAVDPWKGTRTVTGISLPPMNNLYGTLPPEVHHLRYLKILHVQHNKGVTGPIPFQYGWLPHLTTFALINNDIGGKIPRTFALLNKMEILRLEENQLSGDTTLGDLEFLWDMKSLEKLTLDYNAKLTGTLPDYVSKLTKLRMLTLSNTNMYGTLPASLSELRELRALYLDDCNFEGSVEVLYGMTNLSYVYLEDNAFNDTIDDTFFADSKDLVHLDVSNCSFSGSVPGHFFNLSKLEVLDMSLNNLGGVLPVEEISIAKESSLSFLSLHTNGISGPIPPSMGNLKKLTTLDLSSNQFSFLPSEIGGLSNLEILFLGRNKFPEGPLPGWIRNMTQLTELSLKGSSLTSYIPSWLGELVNLQLLDLGENDLVNTIPQSLSKLSKLMVLILNDNFLEGELGLGELKMLETIIIDGNALTGTTADMCAHVVTHFIADCAHSNDASAELECDCCTLCCFDKNATCNDSEWLGNHGGMWETGYNRLKWDFDDGMISPLLNYNILQ